MHLCLKHDLLGSETLQLSTPGACSGHKFWAQIIWWILLALQNLTATPYSIPGLEVGLSGQSWRVQAGEQAAFGAETSCLIDTIKAFLC